MKNIALFTVVLFAVLGMAFAFDAEAQVELQQKLSDVSSTLDSAATQIENIKQKGALQVLWENVTAPLTGIWSQISGILNQIGSILSSIVG